MPAPSPLPKYLWKILPEAPPTPLPARLPLSDLDRNDGFIHLSTSEQVPGTVERFFGTASALWLFKIRYGVLEAGVDGDGGIKQQDGAWLQWDDNQSGCFPHFYRGDLGHGNILEVVKVDKGASWAESLSTVLEW